MTSRRTLVLGASAAGLLPTFAPLDATAQRGAAADAPPPAILRYAFPVAETGFDPVKLNDLYSRTLTAHIFEALYGYDHLARPVKIRPRAAAAMPEVSADFRVWTIPIRQGVFFADDPAFKGRKRELVAQDFVYVFQRYADPANKAVGWTEVETFGLVGLNELHADTLAAKKPFDYERPIDGVKAVNRYTLRLTLKEPRPRLLEPLSESDLFGAVAREVVEFYGDQIAGHPVGTGPFRLAEWRRSSRIVLERNPDYREVRYDAEPAAGDAEGQALLARFKGRRLPMVDRVEISIIEEAQPRWLSFVNGEADLVERVPSTFINLAMPGGRVAPNLAKRGVRGYRQVEPGGYFILFNMDDPVVGGYTPEKVALRRAIGLGFDSATFIRLVYRGQAIPAESPIVPYTTGYDPAFKSEMDTYDPGRAMALLDLYGYVDRDGDGYRERPDGSPLVLLKNTQADQNSREIEQFLTKGMKALGLRLTLKVAQWPENLKTARSGNYMLWNLGGLADVPDGITALARYDGRQIGGQNMARFRNAEFDRLYDRLLATPDGPARDAMFLEAKRIAVAYMPYKMMMSRITTDMSYPRLVGYRRPIFWQDWWQYIEIDDAHGGVKA